ncbi:MAG TPA: sulfite exporter TauE/SafE family protein [Hyphomicrobiaceae bacterium]|nr:sulfite exporter TauE/SafE family protein [Hyphomicrobiaceae bacterium]
MPVYLPIAGMSVDLFLMTGVGAAIGFIAGMLGVGGGFLVTPLLAVLGIPTDVAVATGANQAVAASASGTLAQWQRGNIDLKMGALLIAGGVVGATAGVYLLRALRLIGQIDFVISVLYVALLGALGLLMLIEGARAALQARAGRPPVARLRRHTWLHSLPLKTRFPGSKLYMSLIPPVVLGVLVGLLGGVMGVGGGFFAVPVMVYLFGMPTRVVVGTSLLQVLATSVLTTVLQAWANQSVDVVLAAMLMLGGVVGAQFGARAGHNMRAEYLRALLGLLVVAVSMRIAVNLTIEPTSIYSLDVPR